VELGYAFAKTKSLQHADCWMAGLLNDITLVSINVVTLRRAWLVAGWVTVLGRVTAAQNQPPRSTQLEPSLRG